MVSNPAGRNIDLVSDNQRDGGGNSLLHLVRAKNDSEVPGQTRSKQKWAFWNAPTICRCSQIDNERRHDTR